MFNHLPFFYGTFATGPEPLATILWSTTYSYIPNSEAEELLSTEYYYNYSVGIGGTGGGGYDPDAQAFFDAIGASGGSLTSTEMDATNQLVLDLKFYEIWDKFIGLWPVVGSTEITQSFNLKDPTQYNLGFNGTWSFSSAGASPGGDGYASTGIIPSVIDFQSLGSIHYSLYITENNPDGGYDMGAYNPPQDWGILTSFFGNNTAYIGVGNGWFTTGNGGTTKRNWLMTNDGSNNYIYADGNLLTSGGGVLNTGSIYDIYICANHRDGTAVDFSSRDWALASIGLGMDSTQTENYDIAVQTFQTSLSRQN